MFVANVMRSLRKVVCLRKIVNNESANISLMILILKPILASAIFFEQNSGTELLSLVLVRLINVF